MATKGIQTGQVGGRAGIDAGASLAAQQRNAKMGEVLRRLGTDDPTALSPGGQKRLEGLLDRHAGDLDALDVGKAANAVRGAVARDFGAAFDAGPPPDDVPF